MKFLNQLFFSLLYIIFLSSCGGGESTDVQETETNSNTENNTNTEASTEESDTQTMCFYAENEFENVGINLKIEGNQVTGSAYLEVPKAGFSLYKNYNVDGTKSGDKFNLTFITADTDNGQDIGERSQNTFSLEGEELIVTKGGFFEVPLKLEECLEGTSFYFEETVLDTEEKTYYYKGTIKGDLKIVMVLHRTVDLESPKTDILNGYYYYESQGEDKKIKLEGALYPYDALADFLVEIADGKEYGRFVMEEVTLGEDIYCTWVSADGEKEYEVVLNPDN